MGAAAAGAATTTAAAGAATTTAAAAAATAANSKDQNVRESRPGYILTLAGLLLARRRSFNGIKNGQNAVIIAIMSSSNHGCSYCCFSCCSCCSLLLMLLYSVASHEQRQQLLRKQLRHQC